MWLNRFKYYIFSAWATLFVCLILNVNSFGQEKQFKFTEIRGSNDISLGKINAITQDKNGFLWLSAQNNSSIICYDGTNMIQISTNMDDSNDSKSLGGYYPECLFTENEILWIGFYGQGLDRYDMSTQTFTHYRNDPDDPESLASDYVTSVHRDRFGNLWVGTYGGLDLFDEQTGTFIHHKREAGNKQSLTSDSVRVVYEDKEGTLWVGTGMPWDPNSRGGLNRYNRENNNFTQYVHDPADPNSLINNNIRAIFEDSRGNFWVGTGGDGLHSMNRETGKFTRHTYDPKNPNRLSRPPVIDQNQDHITFIQEDRAGNIWIGTDQNGINVYNPYNKTIKHYGDEVDNGVWCMYISNDNQIWITTNQSTLIKVDPEYTTVPAYYGQLRRKYEVSDSVRWFGTVRGLIKEIHSGPKSSMEFYSIPPQQSNNVQTNYKRFTEQPISLDFLVPLHTLENGNVLFRDNIDYGIQLFDPEMQNVSSFEFGDSISVKDWDAAQVFLAPDSIYWIGSWGEGLIRYDAKNNLFQKYENDYTNGRSLCSNLIFNIQSDTNGGIWLATFNGIQKYIPSTNDFSNFLLGTVSFQLLFDSKGVLWAATQKGVYYYDPVTEKFQPAEIEGPQYSIFEDLNDSSLWFGSDNGVYKLNASRQYVSFFEMEALNSKVKDERYYWTITESYRINDKIYLGAGGDLPLYYVFDPDKLSEPKISAIPYFSALKLRQKLVDSEPNGPLKTAIEETNTLKLANDQNIFSFELGTIDFKNRYDKEIFYMLEGYDLEWKKTASNEQIDYFKVPAGDYVLRIKTPNSDGTWNEKAMEIIIEPPFYLTLWAYIIYFILLSIIVYGIHRTQKARVLRKERERNKDRELIQAKEIEKAYTELKATQNQLIQAEKMASLGELTAGIAHEIQNPLNFVNNFSEVSSELLIEMQEEIEAGNYDEVKEIIQDVIQNLEKILNHGQRADGIVKSMLHHSRGNTGEKVPTNINLLADEYLRLSYHGLRAKDNTFNAVFNLVSDETLPKINVVPQDIGRVFLNLINNAFHAVKEKSMEKIPGYVPTVTITTKLISAPPKKQHIEIRVFDNGNGIPDSLKRKIFQPFFTTKPTGQGTGLGLSLSYDIIKAHGGILKVESTVGQKTEFIIEIPI